MKRVEEIGHQILKGVILELEDRFEGLNYADIGLLAESVIGISPNYLWQSCLAYFRIHFSNSKTANNSLYDIVHGTKSIKLSVSNNSTLNSYHVYLINITNEKKSSLITKNFDLTNCGHYQFIAYTYSEEYSHYVLQLHIVLEILVRGISFWMREKVYLLASEKSALASGLYSFIRARFANDQLANAVWLLTISNGKVFYYLDKQMIEKGLKASLDTAIELNISPIRLFSSLINMDLKLEDSNALKSLEANKCLCFKIGKSKYSPDRPEISYATGAILNSNYSCIFPLHKDNHTFLLALFPKELKGSIVPLLEANKEEISLEFKEYHNRIQKVLRRLTQGRRGLRSTESGNFLGSVLWGFVDGMTKS